MEENRMKKHVTAIAIIQIVLGSINMIGGLTVGLAFKFAEQFIPEPEVISILNFISVPLTIMLCSFGGLMIAGAIGLLSYKTWGKIITLVMGGLGLINVPVGTLKGVYIIWALVQPETNQLFDEKEKGSITQQN